MVKKLRARRIFSLCDVWDEKDKPIFYANFQYNDGYHIVSYDAYAETASPSYLSNRTESGERRNDGSTRRNKTSNVFYV